MMAQDAADFGSEPSVKSPNAAGLSTFGAVPVSLYNGLIQPSVSISQFQCGDIQIPISLNYYSAGNRLDAHPSWVGLGWHMNVCGMVTRQKNGQMDELMVGNGRSGYFFRHAELSATDWFSTSNMAAVTYLDLSPDEFSVSVNGFSGSFYMAADGTFKIKSKSNKTIKVTYEMGPYQTIPNVITKFTITTDDGFKYVFGGTNAIEISQPALPDFEGSYSYYETHPEYNSIIPTAWLLTTIISPLGNKVSFNYSSAPMNNISQIVYYTHSFGINVNTNNTIYYEDKDNMLNEHLTFAYYLESIQGSNGLNYQFKRSFSNELQFPSAASLAGQGVSFIMYSNVPDQVLDQHCKLDSIICKYDNQLLNKVAFNYLERSTERLKLKEVKFIATDTLSSYSYKFEYNQHKLPYYNTGKTDHFGFYNNKTFCCSPHPQDKGVTYFQSRETDTTFAKYEMLRRITYPTNGYTDFQFEPNSYSKYVVQDSTSRVSASVISLGTNNVTGGVRIRKTISYDGMTDKPIIKEYFYTTGYLTGGSISSGVLAGIPKYYEEASGTNSANQSVTFSNLNSNPLNEQNLSDGNFITYSEVTEKKGDEGFIVHTFSNHDNGFSDNPTVNTISLLKNVLLGIYRNKTVGKLELERGALLSNKYYSATKNLIREEINSYNSERSRYDSCVHAIQYSSSLFPDAILKTAFNIYTFHPYLAQSVIKQYDVNGNVQIDTISYTYHPFYRFLRSVTYSDSKGIKTTTSYKYPVDRLGAQDPTGIYQKMMDSNRLSIVLEETKTTGTVQLSSKKSSYYSPYPGIIVPSTVQQTIKASAIPTIINFSSYDAKGNILEVAPQNDIKNVFLWGYNGQFPVAKISGADYTTVMQYVSQSILDNPASDAALRSAMDNLRANLKDALISTYTYKPFVGMTSETDFRGVSSYYEYDNFNRLKLVRDKDNNIVKQLCYSYDGQLVNCDGSTTFFYNDQKSQTYTTTCPAGYTPGTYTYVVPANKYMSVISKADANRKAQKELDEFGQDYADGNGTCTQICTNCTTEGFKCINGVCEQGETIYTSSTEGPTGWTCIYHYRWSDGSISSNYSVIANDDCL
jgi:hypothetical protein